MKHYRRECRGIEEGKSVGVRGDGRRKERGVRGGGRELLYM